MRKIVNSPKIRRLNLIVSSWAAPILLMIIIFILSSRPRTSITTTFTIDFIIFKSLHMIEYGLLFFLIYRALSETTRLNGRAKVIGAMIITIGYAITDEIHQTFVPSREGTVRDILIDTAGASIVYLIYAKNS